MKAIVLLLILAAGAYLLLRTPSSPSSSLPPRPQPPTVASLEPPLSPTPPPKPTPVDVIPRTIVNPNEPIIEAEGVDIAVIKGAVTKVNGEVATINCEYLPPFDESTLVFPMGMSRDYILRQIAEAKAKFYAETFGHPQIFNEGKYTIAPWIPKQKAKGLVTLRGTPLSEGQVVHLVGASVKRTVLGTPAVAFTARFKAVGNYWMWSETGRTALEPTKP